MLLDLNTNIDNALAGYRLHSLEVFNWGTFNGVVWSIQPDGRNALLTGNIGSGKSTLVDAVTTLLVPSRKITYNKAAGAATKERSLKTYVLGAFKNEKVASSARARDVFLREPNKTYSVLVANFSNVGTNDRVALAQVLYMGSGGGVNRVYIVAQRHLSVAGDLSDFGNDTGRLTRRLRADRHVTVHKTFSQYAADFRRRFGLAKPEALELFYQTVSMKQVGNLTEFVRERMLGETDIGEQIQRLVKTYADATAAHESILKARRQLEALAPLVVANTDRLQAQKQLTELRELQAEVPKYFAYQGVMEQQGAMTQVQSEWERNRHERRNQQQLVDDAAAKLARLQSQLQGHGVYQQLQDLDHHIILTTNELNRRKSKADAYAERLAQLGESAPHPAADPAAFTAQRLQLRQLAEEVQVELQLVAEENNERVVQRTGLERELNEIERDLESLRRRPTNIPRRNLDVRDRLLTELGLTERDLPFAGELLQVREGQGDWEGAIERVLHGLGLSLLVNDDYYQDLSRLVDRLDLKGRLVYLRTLKHRTGNRQEPDDRSLVRKVKIKGDTEFYDWLEQELELRYDYECCDNLEEFRRTQRGLTRRGQIKSGRQMHSKDDRHRIDDRRRYVLGWSNREKIRALEADRDQLTEELRSVTALLSNLRTRDLALRHKEATLNDLDRNYPEFSELDFAQSSRRLQELREERQSLERQSQQLADLQRAVDAAKLLHRDAREALDKLTKSTGQLETRTVVVAARLYDLLKLIELPPPDLDIDPENPDVAAITAAYGTLDVPFYQASPRLRKILKKLGEAATENSVRERIDGSQGLIARANRELSRHERTITTTMGKYQNFFPDEVRDLDATLDSLPEYLGLHRTLERDKLPEFEGNFRTILKEETIRGILIFENQLRRFEEEIRQKIDRINEHLRAIDYDARAGTYITITRERVHNEEIAEFQRDLKRALSGTVGGSTDVYNEGKFFEVKKLLDRFESATLTDQNWTRRVTDVRQWFEFGADERYRETEKSKEFYSDSAGKSGGQKEKLAYTILASAIAFQFGLQAGKSTDRSFRFVVIDEAFGKGSDDSTRYALELFKQMNLQLLIVTPLQKINVIEDYVANVHFVDNPGGKNSRVRNITIEHYREQRALARAAEVNAGR